MILPIRVNTSSGSPSSASDQQDQVTLFEVDVTQKNPRYEALWNSLTPFQQEHHQLVLQIGKLQLPLDPSYRQQTHPSFQENTTSNSSHLSPSPPARLLRGRGRDRDLPIELHSLSTYSSDETDEIFSEIDDDDDDEEEDNRFATDEDNDDNDIDSDEQEESVANQLTATAVLRPTTGDNDNDNDNDNDIDTAAELVFTGFEVQIFLEDREEIGESDMLQILLLVPKGTQRLQVACCTGYVRVTSNRRWLLKNGEHDVEGLYTLFLTSNMNKFSLSIDTKTLQEQLQMSMPLHSRSSFFNFFEQEREHAEWKLNNLNDTDIELCLGTLRNSPIPSTTEMQQQHFLLGEGTGGDSSERYQVQWKYHAVSVIQLLNRNGPMYVHTQHKRFLTSPSEDLYSKSSSVSVHHNQHYQVNLRGICLTHPAGIGKRRLVTNMMKGNGLIGDEQAKILVLCFEAQKSVWLTYLQHVQVVTWESIHEWLKDIPAVEDYYGYFRQVSSEVQYFPNSHHSQLVQLLRVRWDHIVFDDVIHAIAGQKSKRDAKITETLNAASSSDERGPAKREPWYCGSYPLYHFLQNIQASRLIATARDFRPRTSKEVLAMGGLLQKFGDVPLLQRFRDTAPSSLLYHIMTQNLVGVQKRSILEREMSSQLIHQVIEAEMTQYEEMAQTDLKHRYTIDITNVDFDRVPVSSLALILTISSSERMMVYRDFYEHKTIHTFQSVHQKLQHKFACEAYHLSLLNREENIIPTHFSSPTILAAPRENHIRQLLTMPSNLLTEFSCANCFEKEPKKSYDYVVSKCGHFACWACLSQWIVHQRWKKDDDNYAVPCMSCRLPLSDEDVYRYRSTNTLNFVPEETTKPYFAALERQHKRIALSSSKDQNSNPQHIHSAKVTSLIKYLRQKQNGNKRIVLFTQHVDVSTHVEEILLKERFEVLRYKGRRSQRERIQEKFERKKHVGVVLLSLNSESKYEQIDLSHSTDAIIFLDNCYQDPMQQELVENSIIGRIHRANRTRPLHVVRLLQEGSQEADMYQKYLKRDSV